MSSRPYIHCFMLTSIDGKVTGKFLNNPEAKPYVSKLEISEDIIDNEVDKLFENKQNKPKIKSHEKKNLKKKPEEKQIVKLSKIQLIQ